MNRPIEKLNFIIYNSKTNVAEAFETEYDEARFNALKQMKEVTIINDMETPNERTIFISQSKIPTLHLIFECQQKTVSESLYDSQEKEENQSKFHKSGMPRNWENLF